MADTTSGAVTASGIASERNSFIANQYGSDVALGALSNVSIPSAYDVSSWRSALPSGDKPYWLSNTKNIYGIPVQAFSNADNTLGSVSKTLSGKAISGETFVDQSVGFGFFDIAAETTLSNFTQPSGTYIWSLGSDAEAAFYNYYTSSQIFTDGMKVYNNPFCSEDADRGYYAATASVAANMVTKALTAKVVISNNTVFISQVSMGDTIAAGDTVCYDIGNGALSDTLGFRTESNGLVKVYFKAANTAKVTGQDIYTFNIRGVYHGVEESTTITGSTLAAGSYGVRPTMDIDTSKIAFLRESTSGTSLTTSSTLTGSEPSSNAWNGSNYKAVVKDTNTTISAALSNATTDKGAVTVSGSTVKVPWGATKITIPVTSTNANYLSALVNTSRDLTLYGEVAQANSSSITLDIDNLVNNKLVGSKAEVSLYSEQANAQGNSNTISSKPVSFTLQVDYGAEHTLTYDAAGGTGANLPSATKYRTGTTITAFDGSTLVNNGNPFSRYLVSWTEEDGTAKTALVKSGEPFTIPDADITFTALYSGIDGSKTTSTEGTYAYTITFDADGGTFSDGSSTQSQEKKKDETITDPGTPTKSGYKFLSWKLTSGIGPDDPIGSNPTGHATYTAQWEELKAFWLAPARASDPTEDMVQTDTQIKAAATDIASKGSSSTYYSTYRTYMNNDKYHLYTKLTDGTYLEARIVQVGPHDGDGSGLTFQAVHSLPRAYPMNYGLSNVGGWASMPLRTNMNSGAIYNLFDTNFTSQVKSVSKVSAIGGGSTSTTTSSDKFWIMSFSEFTGTSTIAYASDIYTQSEGSQYAYWSGKVTATSGENAALVGLGATRDGNSPSGSTLSVWGWLRSTYGSHISTTLATKQFLNISRLGSLYSNSNASESYAIIPCFSF